MLRKKPKFNIQFGYINNIVILRTGLTIFYITVNLIINVKNVFN